MIEIKPPRFPKGIIKNRTPKSILKKAPKLTNQLDGCEDIPEKIETTIEKKEDVEDIPEIIEATVEKRKMLKQTPLMMMKMKK